MADEQGTSNQSETPEAQAVTEGQEQPKEGAQPPEGGKGEAEDGLPAWAREKLNKANTQAASYRTQLRDAEAKLKEAKTVEEFEQVRADFASQIADYERQIMIRDVADETGLPKGLAARLQGDDREALVADAKALAKLVGSQQGAPTEPSGGLNPSEPVDTEGPVARAARIRKASGR